MISKTLQNRKMSPKCFNLILYYIFTTSCIISGSGLNVEGVSSGDEQEDKSRENKGKKPIENPQNLAENLKMFHTIGVEKERQNSSSSSSTSVKTMKKSSYTTAELALITALENVCKDFKIGDLLNAGSVCRSWNQITERENSNRGLERALLPSIYSNAISNVYSDFHVYNVLNTKPSVAILFLAPMEDRRPSTCQYLDEGAITVYRRFFPQHLVTVGVDVSMMDEKNISSCSTFLHPADGILGLFMPHHNDIQIKVSSCSILEGFYPPGCATKIINDIKLDSNKKKSTIIVFGNIDGIKEVVDLIKINFIHKSYSLWGGLFKNSLIHSKTKDNISGKSSIFALNLSGSNIKSWSIFFDCGIEEHEIIEKLFKFKNSLKLQQYTIGLVCGPEIVVKVHPVPTYVMTHKQLMHLVKHIFPNIPFIGIFKSGYNIQIGVDSLSDDNNQQLIANNFLSLMIITN